MTISERNTIFEQHRNIIYYTVHKHRSLREAMRMDFEDLVQELSFCLLDAIERYDPNRGAKDTTYYFKRLRYGLLDLWRAHIRDIRLANNLTAPLTYLDDNGEETGVELPFEVDYDTDLIVQEFLETLSRREREALARNIAGQEPEDKRHKRYIDVIKRKARRFQLSGGAF